MVNSRFRNPRVIVLSADQIVNNSTTFVDTLLKMENIPVGQYMFYLHLLTNATAVADIQFKAVLTNCTAVRSHEKFTFIPSPTQSLTSARNLASDASDQFSVFIGTLLATASGTITIQIAQTVQEVSNSTLRKGTTLLLYGTTP